MQDQLKSNFFSITLQGQQQKSMRELEGEAKTTLSFPHENKANKKLLKGTQTKN